MFMRVNSKCAHLVRPPPGRRQGSAAAGQTLGTARDQAALRPALASRYGEVGPAAICWSVYYSLGIAL